MSNLLEMAVMTQGFLGLEEFNKLISEVDISTQEKLAKFKDWQNGDGSKAGLKLLLVNNSQEVKK